MMGKFDAQRVQDWIVDRSNARGFTVTVFFLTTKMNSFMSGQKHERYLTTFFRGAKKFIAKNYSNTNYTKTV